MAEHLPKFDIKKSEEDKQTEQTRNELHHNNKQITSSETFIIGDKQFTVRADDLIQLKECGRGAYGVVYAMKHQETGTIMAVKRVRAIDDNSQRKYLMTGLNVIKKSKGCPYIVTFYGVLLKEGDLWICMELMDNSLDKLCKLVYHKLKQSFSERILGKIAVAILKALHYLKEELSVMHRDVKPSNVLIGKDGSIKMCDFGIAGMIIDSKCYTRLGYEAFMAPERVSPPSGQKKKGYDIRSDVWSFGCTLYELSTGKPPYPSWESIFEQLKLVVQGPPPRLGSTDLSSEFKEFTHMCLEKDVSKRPRYDTLLKHQFILTTEADHDTDVGAWYQSVLVQATAN